jgi:catechol 2,3-dioxygenase-like lactoylglutathione lyase family enzyme
VARPARLHHTSLGVRDLDASLGFYARAFGCTPTLVARDMTDLIRAMTGLAGLRCDLAQLRVPGSDHVLELVAFHDVPPGRADDAPVRAGHGHVSFAVDDLDAALARLEGLGARRVGAVTAFPDGRAVYLREPGGSVVELDEPSSGESA